MRSLPTFRSRDQHPSRHADFFAALVGLDRDNQILASSTTSAELVSTMRSEQVIDS